MTFRWPPRAAMIVSVATGVSFIALCFAHVNGVNGPRWWAWPWYERPDYPTVIALMLLAGSPALIAQLLPRRFALVAVLLVAATPSILQPVAISLSPFDVSGMRRAEEIVRHRTATSYYTVAQALEPLDGWMALYDQVIAKAPMHAATKPPGPVLFFVAVLKAFGDARAPLVASVLISLLTALAVAATYAAVRAMAGHEVGLQAATLLALAPSVTVFYPSLDTIYPMFTALLLATWFLALERERAVYATAFGLVLFVLTLTSYALLVVGSAFVILALQTRKWLVIAKQSAIALGVVVALYAVLWIVTGFDPVASFEAALARQETLLSRLPRRYPATILWDLSDFAFGLGWMPVVLALLSLRHPETRWFSMACIATPVIVALTGLLQSETARVWIFLMPLIAFAAALEMARWQRRDRLIVHATLLLCTIAVFANAVFIWI